MLWKQDAGRSVTLTRGASRPETTLKPLVTRCRLGFSRSVCGQSQSWREWAESGRVLQKVRLQSLRRRLWLAASHQERFQSSQTRYWFAMPWSIPGCDATWSVSALHESMAMLWCILMCAQCHDRVKLCAGCSGRVLQFKIRIRIRILLFARYVCTYRKLPWCHWCTEHKTTIWKTTIYKK